MSSQSHKDAGRRYKRVKTRVSAISSKAKLTKNHSQETGNINIFHLLICVLFIV